MKTWIASAIMALALAAGAAAATPAAAHDQWNGGGWQGKPGWNGGHGWNGGPGWNGGTPPWLGYNNPAWPHGQNGCIFDRHGEGWDCGPQWQQGHKKFVPERTILSQVYQAGYRHVFDIDRDGHRYEVRAVDYRGRHVLLTFNARTGDFIKKRFL